VKGEEKWHKRNFKEAYLSGRIRTLTKADNLIPFELTNMRVSVQYMYITLVNIITHYVQSVLNLSGHSCIHTWQRT
jgi:hypothetical protein